MPSAAARRGRTSALASPARLRRVRRATGKAARPGPSARRRQLRLLSRLAPGRPARRRGAEATALGGAAGAHRGARGHAAPDLPQTVLRNVALEAVRVGNYWAEDQEAVLGYIREQFERLLADRGWLAAEQDLRQENAFTKRYSVDDILRKQHEADGFNVFVSPEEALLQRQAEERRAQGRPAPEPGRLAELQEGLEAAVADGDAVGEEELLELLEGCAGAGEVAAAVFCGERLADMGGESGGPGLDRAFEALKPLLRPSAAAPEPQLAGPWSGQGRGPAQAAKAARQGLARLLSRLAAARKARDSAGDADAAARGAAAADAERCLRRLGDAVTPLLLGDSEAASCNRRGSLAEALLRLCREGGLQASARLAGCLVGELERRGVVRTQGRALEVRASAEKADTAAEPVAALSGDLERLEATAQERLQRRRKRQQARQQTRAAKRRRAEG